MHELEKRLYELVTKKIPYQISDRSRSTLVKALPWLSIVSGALFLLVAWGVYRAISIANTFSQYVYLQTYPYTTSVPRVSPLLWVLLICLVAAGILLLVAYTGLRDHKRRGWQLAYWAMLLYVLYGLVEFLVRLSFGALLVQWLCAAISLYLLFEVRDYYGAVPAPKQVTPHDKAGKPTIDSEQKSH